MVERSVTRWVAEDGMEFEDRQVCELYEKVMDNVVAVKVRYGTDLTEGRYWLRDSYYDLYIPLVKMGDTRQNTRSIALYSEMLASQLFGKRVDCVMGYAEELNNVLDVYCVGDPVYSPNLVGLDGTVKKVIFLSGTRVVDSKVFDQPLPVPELKSVIQDLIVERVKSEV